MKANRAFALYKLPVPIHSLWQMQLNSVLKTVRKSSTSTWAARQKKKVNKKLAGSALLQYPTIIEEILKAVVNAVDVPVTLKTRTGWDTDNKNCVQIAKLAEDCGIQALALHGRTKACMYKGEAEYDSIKAVKEAISIPVIANGDIDSPEKAKFVLEYTGADALMIGRPAQGRPWIFQEIHHYLENGTTMDELPTQEVKALCLVM